MPADILPASEQWVQAGAHTFGIMDSLLRSQGVANDGRGNFWFSSQRTLLRTHSASGPSEKTNMLPFSKELRKRGVHHIGDIDYANGKIFAPLEGGPDYEHPLIGIFDAETLKLDTFTELPRNQQKDGVPWVAVDAKQGCVYSSQYEKATAINVYRLSTLEPLGQIKLSVVVDAIQGAKVLNGSLYMTANASPATPSSEVTYAIHKMDLATGEVVTVGGFQGKLNEVEGMTFVPRGTGHDLYVLGQVGSGLNIRMALHVFQLKSQ